MTTRLTPAKHQTITILIVRLRNPSRVSAAFTAEELQPEMDAHGNIHVVRKPIRRSEAPAPVPVPITFKRRAEEPHGELALAELLPDMQAKLALAVPITGVFGPDGVRRISISEFQAGETCVVKSAADSAREDQRAFNIQRRSVAKLAHQDPRKRRMVLTLLPTTHLGGGAHPHPAPVLVEVMLPASCDTLHSAHERVSEAVLRSRQAHTPVLAIYTGQGTLVTHLDQLLDGDVLMYRCAHHPVPAAPRSSALAAAQRSHVASLAAPRESSASSFTITAHRLSHVSTMLPSLDDTSARTPAYGGTTPSRADVSSRTQSRGNMSMLEGDMSASAAFSTSATSARADDASALSTSDAVAQVMLEHANGAAGHALRLPGIGLESLSLASLLRRIKLAAKLPATTEVSKIFLPNGALLEHPSQLIPGAHVMYSCRGDKLAGGGIGRGSSNPLGNFARLALESTEAAMSALTTQSTATARARTSRTADRLWAESAVVARAGLAARGIPISGPALIGPGGGSGGARSVRSGSGSGNLFLDAKIRVAARGATARGSVPRMKAASRGSKRLKRKDVRPTSAPAGGRGTDSVGANAAFGSRVPFTPVGETAIGGGDKHFAAI